MLMQEIKVEMMDMSCAQVYCSWFTMLKKLPCSSCPLPAAIFSSMPPSSTRIPANRNCQHRMVPSTVVCSRKDSRRNADQIIDVTPCTSDGDSSSALNGKAIKGSGTTARGRRLLKVQEEKRKREYERLHNYPSWAK